MREKGSSGLVDHSLPLHERLLKQCACKGMGTCGAWEECEDLKLASKLLEERGRWQKLKIRLWSVLRL
jgi:hypothetical protein